MANHADCGRVAHVPNQSLRPDSALGSLIDPGVEALTVPLPQHRGEVLCQGIRGRQMPVLLQEVREVGVLFGRALLQALHEQAGHLSCRGAARSAPRRARPTGRTQRRIVTPPRD
jgi:hypothetical protein